MYTRKPIVVLLFLMLAVMFSACNSSDKNSGAAANAQQTSINDTSTNAPGDDGDNAPMKWPGSLMGSLPVPKGNITSIDKESKLAPDIIVVSFSEMKKEDAADYVKQLQELGYANGVSINNETSVLFSGSDSKNTAVSFSYKVEDKTGFVSYNPKAGNSAK